MTRTGRDEKGIADEGDGFNVLTQNVRFWSTAAFANGSYGSKTVRLGLLSTHSSRWPMSANGPDRVKTQRMVDSWLLDC
ncbi:hypothetical protein, partial [Pseudomonas aeruginosa]|uniref:hypothetical protein n=1 Tax=Pseudomonas aeruginosa TaxID=287 RepID=UPI00396896AC